jgi:hypothetical protein
MWKVGVICGFGIEVVDAKIRKISFVNEVRDMVNGYLLPARLAKPRHELLWTQRRAQRDPAEKPSQLGRKTFGPICKVIRWQSRNIG